MWIDVGVYAVNIALAKLYTGRTYYINRIICFLFIGLLCS